MSAYSDIQSVVSSVVLIGGFGLNAIVAWRNGNKAQEGVKIAAKALNETKEAIDESKKVLDEVASKTDGRLTEVINKSGALEEQVDALKKALEKERIASAINRPSPRKPSASRTPKKPS